MGKKTYSGRCPKCNTALHIEVEREVVSEPVAGEYRDVVTVDVNSQKTLDLETDKD